MIGGVDVILSSRTSREQAIVASLRVIRRFWRDAVVEDAYTSQRIKLTRDSFIPEMASAVFVYPNEETADRWDELGAEPELANTMIQIIASESEVTVVVDDPDSGIIPAVISGLRSALSMDIFWTRAEIRGAAA